jgi:ferredoxin
MLKNSPQVCNIVLKWITPWEPAHPEIYPLQETLPLQLRTLCVCGTCEIVCPTNAIKNVDDHAEIDKSRCNNVGGSCTACMSRVDTTEQEAYGDPRTIADIRFTSKEGKYVLRGLVPKENYPV